ncbi:MAG: tyrosine-protein phosphatase [Bacteroidaceae bacterium]|nr:tyrosine-protein phosphatase [Bacteroidaceae bacterium]
MKKILLLLLIIVNAQFSILHALKLDLDLDSGIMPVNGQRSMVNADTLEVVNIEHPALQAYMADSTYYYNDTCDVTVIPLYANPSIYGHNLDYPQGKALSWVPTTTADNIAEIRITLSEKPNFRDSLSYFPTSTNASSYTIYNLFPYRTYYYKAEEIHYDGTVAPLVSGTFRTEGQVRMMRIDGASNVRDIGGWPTQFGVPLKYGILYRSGHLDNVTPAGYHAFVDNMNLRAELDLRGLFRREPHLRSSQLGDSITYTRIVADSYGLSSQRYVYAQALRWILDRLREGKVVDWHCGVGCDRCGTLSFLIEGVLGVGEVDLCRDYELSCFKGHKRYRGHVGFRKLLPYIKKLGPEGDLAQCFYNYWLESGMTEDELDYLRFVMLDY